MKYFIKYKWFFFFLMGINCSNAQVIDNAPWCPSGATWTYIRGAVFGEIYVQLEYEKDTVIDGIVTKKLSTREIEYYSDPNDPLNNYSRSEYPIGGAEFYYESNDSIYWYHNGGFQFLYDFGASVGDEWRVEDGEPYGCPTPVGGDTFVVDSTNTKVYDGRQFDAIHGSMNGNNWVLGDLIVKNIGSLNAPFPQPGTNCTVLHGSAGSLGGLNCYYDDIRGFVSFGSRRDCQEMITPIHKIPNNNLAENQANWKIYPNPTNRLLQVEWTDYSKAATVGEIQYTLYNISGQKLLQTIDEVNTILDISHLSSGVYFLTLSDQSNQVLFSHKIIKI